MVNENNYLTKMYVSGRILMTVYLQQHLASRFIRETSFTSSVQSNDMIYGYSKPYMGTHYGYYKSK